MVREMNDSNGDDGENDDDSIDGSRLVGRDVWKSYLGLFVPSSVSVSVSDPVGQEEELRGVEGSEKERLSI